MPDPRHQKLAQVLIHYSLAIKPGDKLSISGHAVAAPLIREVYREAIRAGAHVTTYIDIDGLREIYYREARAGAWVPYTSFRPLASMTCISVSYASV